MGHGEKSFDRNYYKRFFSGYNKKELKLYYQWHWGWANFLDSYLPIKAGNDRRVLEIGSSIGSFSKVLKERDFEVVASDISSFIVQKGRKVLKGVAFVKVDVEKGIDLKGQFDYIFAFEVLEHLKDPEKALRNIKEKLEKGGVLVFSTPFPTKRALSDPTHINIHHPSYWKKLGKKFGFRRISFTYASFMPFLYRFSKHLSFGFPVKLNLPYINSTSIFFFTK